jgi:hypothetical protein
MWTRLVAGAAAHDINNLAQGLFNLLALASSPTASPEALERYAGLAREGLLDLKRLASDLRALSATEAGGEAQRLDLACLEAHTEVAVPEGRSLEMGPAAAGVLVLGTGPAVRVALTSVLRYCLAASASGGGVMSSIPGGAAQPTVVVDAPTAPPPHSSDEGSLGALLDGPEREFGGDRGLVVAGAIVRQCGGDIHAGRGPHGGLRFKLTFVRAEEGPQDARRA